MENVVGLEKTQISSRYIDVIKDMYDGAITMSKTIGGEIELFPISVAL